MEIGKVRKTKKFKNKKLVIYELKTGWFYFIIYSNEEEVLESRLHYRYIDALHDFNRSKKC